MSRQGDNQHVSVYDVSEDPPSLNKSMVLWASLAITATVASLGITSTYTRSRSAHVASLFTSINEKNAVRETDTFDYSKGWQVYKVTSSSSSGTYSDIQTFMNTYFAYTTLKNLGCTTEKVAASLYSPFELHFVDSSVFNDNQDRTVEDWATFASTFSASSPFNAFMHNKVQMFVDDLQPHFDLFEKDGIVTQKRLSTSSAATSSNDVAHMGVWMPNAVTMLELVGPASSLDSDSLAEFSEWSEEECPAAHGIELPLEGLLENYAMSKASEQVLVGEWEAETGLPTPMGIQVSVPAADMTHVTSTIDLVTAMNGASVTFTDYNSGNLDCQVAAFSVGSIRVTYVQNDAVAGLTSLSIGDWESDIESAHAKYVNIESTESSWDRYLDSHIGMYVTPADDDQCDDYYTYIASTIAENSGNFQYGQRVTTDFGVGTHYYTGTNGVRSWEFNSNDCPMTGGTDICGCSPINSRVVYEAENDVTSCIAV